jgi:hypothetical protein
MLQVVTGLMIAASGVAVEIGGDYHEFERKTASAQ